MQLLLILDYTKVYYAMLYHIYRSCPPPHLEISIAFRKRNCLTGEACATWACTALYIYSIDTHTSNTHRHKTA